MTLHNPILFLRLLHPLPVPFTFLNLHLKTSIAITTPTVLTLFETSMNFHQLVQLRILPFPNLVLILRALDNGLACFLLDLVIGLPD